jgi:hypothetical protein
MIQQHIAQLLPPVAAAAHSAHKALHTPPGRVAVSDRMRAAQAAEFSRIISQARWLCSLAGKEALQQHAAAVLSVRRVPRELATAVQQAGFQLTDADLIAAARSRVEGLENWKVQGHHLSLGSVVSAVLDYKVVRLCLLVCGTVAVLTACSFTVEFWPAAYEICIKWLRIGVVWLEPTMQRLRLHIACMDYVSMLQVARNVITSPAAKSVQIVLLN